MRNLANRGQETGAGVLRIDARLDGVPAPRDLILPERQPLAHRDPKLPLDEIQARDHFRDGMLDLKAGVHFDEIGVAVVGDELHRARAHIADGGGGFARRLVKCLAPLIVERGRWRFLDHLLVAALQRAFALEQRHDLRRARRRTPAPRCGAGAR